MKTATPIFAQSPVIGIADLSAATALTARTKITGTTGLTQLTPTSTEGKRIDSIRVKSCNTVAGAANQICIWIYNGTTSFLYDELTIAAVTPSATLASADVVKSYSDLVLPPTYQLFVSTTVSSAGNSNASVFAHGGDY